jgi:multimeric flavodoxin WrbA
MQKFINKFWTYLQKKDQTGSRILFLTTSNRWVGEKELPKSSELAIEIRNKLKNCEVIDVSKLKIFPCEGNVSRHGGNNCGVKESMLKDDKKNPHKIVRCWASMNNPSDEMYIVANKIYESDIIVFFGSIRWGKMNAVYTQLIERLTWMENRHTTLGESNILKDKEVGVVAMGHNWNGSDSVELEKQVLGYFGFKTPKELSFNRQWTNDPTEETLKGYKQDYKDFLKEKSFIETLKESYKDFSEWINKKLFS